MTIVLRGNTYYLKKRVPLRFSRIEPRVELWISLKTDSPFDAKQKAVGAWSQLLASWDALLLGKSDDAAERYQAARDLAQARGFRYLPADRVAALPFDKLMERIEAAMDANGKIDRTLATAMLGTAKKPVLKLSDALDLYWTLAADQTRGKSPDQIRRWKNPRIKAFKNLIDVIGDQPVSEVTAEDLTDFRSWWQGKIEADDLTPNSANKDFIHIASTIRHIDKLRQLGLTLTFTGLSLSEGEKRTRLPFSEQWIREKLAAPGALHGLNLEARCILLGMVNTGYRPSEAQSLGRDQIKLDCDHPHISIEPVGRTLKNASSRRIIPLAGISLEAFKACPDGFPRYAFSAGLSATVNKFLRENGIMESDAHSLYGLRHSFEDRLLDRDVDERIRRDLMGHALSRERYGKGASLEKLAAVIQSIAI